jgi:hypothetical protein
MHGKGNAIVDRQLGAFIRKHNRIDMFKQVQSGQANGRWEKERKIT